MKPKPVDKYLTLQALELYKSHYTRKEVHNLLDVSYAIIVTLFRTWDSQRIEKYNRFSLIPTKQRKLFGDLYANTKSGQPT